MDSQLLASRRRMLLHLLSFEDPAYSRINFFTKFQQDVETHIRSHYPGASCSEAMIQAFMQKAIDRLSSAIRSKENGVMSLHHFIAVKFMRYCNFIWNVKGNIL